jgi:ornithine carbamoyltransferase
MRMVDFADRKTYKPLLALSELSEHDVKSLVACSMAYGRSADPFKDLLAGLRVGLLFTAPSTRTRSTFWSAARTLGCDTLHLGPSDLQLTTGETWADTGRMLANVLDVAVVRTNGPQPDLADLADNLPATINALTYHEHPTQAIADLCALRERLGPQDAIRIAYLGQANNTARSLAWLVGKTPMMRLDAYCPSGLGFSVAEVDAINASAGAEVLRQFDTVPKSPDPVDAVYTTRWRSMGAAHAEADWSERFEPFAITEETMVRFSGTTDALFMHDLPAVRDEEATSAVLDGAASLVPRQAFHKASAAAAALLWTTGSGPDSHVPVG